MKHLKGYNKLNENSIFEIQEEIELLEDIFQDISDDGYELDIYPNHTLVNGDVQYGLLIKGSSKNFADVEFYDKSHDMSKLFLSNINRLESMGYEIGYRSMSNTLSNSITYIECKLQFWSRKNKPGFNYI